MARVTKAYQERKNEIMDTAQMLFYTKGYESVSVNLIIATIGISKGTFYHYFRSKEELLDELVKRFTDKAIQIIVPIVEDNSLNALEKLNLIYEKSGRFKLDQVELMKTIINVFYDDDNIKMRYKLRRNSIAAAVPYFTAVFEQGIKEKLFVMDDPEKTAELIFIMGQSLTDKTAVLLKDSGKNPENKEAFRLYLKTYRYCIEKILGLPPDSIVFFKEEELLEFFEWYAK